MSDGVSKVKEMSVSVMEVSDGVRKVSYGFRKVSDGVRNVSGGVRKVSNGVRKVSMTPLLLYISCSYTCSHTTSQNLHISGRNRRHHDHGCALQAKGHGKNFTNGKHSIC